MTVATEHYRTEELRREGVARELHYQPHSKYPLK